MLPHMLRARTFTAGLTLVELIVVIAINTLLMLVITFSIQSLYQQNAYTIAQSREIDNARRGLNELMRDALEMVPAQDGTFPVVVREADRFGFFSDTDQDDGIEYVEFSCSGSSTLIKATHEPTGYPASYDLSTPDRVVTLSRYVQNQTQGTSTFFYYDDSGSLLGGGALLTDVHYVQARLIINVDPFRSPGGYTLRSSVAPRNLIENP